jgi:predicted  nucleic acid-binding Zn-ribbon protein
MAEEHSVTSQLTSLIRLQYIDSRLDQMEKLRGDLPHEISDLEDERAGLNRRIDKYKQEQLDAELERKKISFDQLESQSLIERYQKQQNQVRNNREYDALTKEIEVHRQRIIDANHRLEVLRQRDENNAVSFENVNARLEDLASLVDTKRKELDAVLADTRQEEEMLATKREEVAKYLDGRFFTAYSRLRNRLRDGRAVVPIERGAAGGFAVPPQRQVEVRQRNRIVVCEHTGRIIVDADLFKETTEAMGI